MGHIVEDINKPNIYAREYDKYLRGEITEDAFLEWYRNAGNYEPQLPGYNRGLEELEAQALQAEEIERYNPDTYVCEVINGKSYRMRKSQKAKLDYIVKKGLEEWLEGEEKAMSGRDYLELLINYKEYLERQR